MGILAQGLVGGGWITKGPRGKISVYQFLLKSLTNFHFLGCVFAGGGIRETLPSVAESRQLTPVNHLKVMLEMWVRGGYHHYKNSSMTVAQLPSHSCLFLCVSASGQFCIQLPMLITPDCSSTFSFSCTEDFLKIIYYRKTAFKTFSWLFTESPEPSPPANWVFYLQYMFSSLSLALLMISLFWLFPSNLC